MNFHLHRGICLSGTLITAKAVARLKEAGETNFFRGTPFQRARLRVGRKKRTG